MLARPSLNHFSIELPFTRDNARGVMDLSFPLCKERREEGKGEKRGRAGSMQSAPDTFCIRRKRCFLEGNKSRRLHLATSKLYSVPVSSFKHNRRRGFLEATDYEMSRTCAPYLYYFTVSRVCPLKFLLSREFTAHFRGRGDFNLGNVCAYSDG